MKKRKQEAPLTHSFLPDTHWLFLTGIGLPIFEYILKPQRALRFEKLKMEKIRKEVHLPSDMAHELKIVAAHRDKSVKKFMEDLIVYEVKMQIAKLNRNYLKDQPV